MPLLFNLKILLKNIKKLKKFKEGSRVLVLGHNALDYKSAVKYPFIGSIRKGMHPPAPTSLLYDNWQDFDGDIISCHHQNYNAKFVLAVEPSPRFHEGGGIKVSNCPAYNKESREALEGMLEYNLNPNDYYYIDFPKRFQHKGKTVTLYTGLFAIVFACMMDYKEIYTAGIDGTMLGTDDGFKYKKVYIKEAKKFIRTGKSKLIRMHKQQKPKNMAEWSDWKVIQNYPKTLTRVINYCSYKYPDSNIYKSHKLSKLPVEIRVPL